MLGQQSTVIIGELRKKCQQRMLLTHKLKKNRLPQERLVNDKVGPAHHKK